MTSSSGGVYFVKKNFGSGSQCKWLVIMNCIRFFSFRRY